jgi:hypothetical protein
MHLPVVGPRKPGRSRTDAKPRTAPPRNVRFPFGGMIANWGCFVKSFRIDRTGSVYGNVDVHRGRYRDPLTSPHRLAAIAVVVYGTYKVLGNNIATLASGVDSALTNA